MKIKKLTKQEKDTIIKKLDMVISIYKKKALVLNMKLEEMDGGLLRA